MIFKRAFCGLLVVLVTCVTAHGQPSAAAPPTTQPTTAPTTQATQPAGLTTAEAAAIAGPTIDGVQAKLAAVQSQADLSDEARAEAVKLLNDALAQLQQTEQLQQEAAELKGQREQAAQQLEVLQAELAAPQPEPQIDIPEGAAPDTLDITATEREAEVTAARELVEQLNAEQARRERRRTEIPGEIAAARQELVTLQAPPVLPADAAPAVREAAQLKQQARAAAVRAQIAKLEAELQSYAARKELLETRVALARRAVERAERIAGAWRSAEQAARRAESRRDLRAAEQLIERAGPLAEPWARLNLEWVEARRAIVNEASPRAANRKDALAALLTRVSGIRQDVVKYIGEEGKQPPAPLTTVVGQLLRARRADLPDLAALRSELATWQAEALRVQEAKIGVERWLDDHQDLDADVTELLAPVKGEISDAEYQRRAERARDVLTAARASASSLRDRYESYYNTIQELVGQLRSLEQEAGRLATRIDEKVLWIRSAAPLGIDDIGSGGAALAWLLSPANWYGVGTALLRSAERRAPLVFSVSGLLALLILLRLWMRRQLHKKAELVRSVRTDALPHTVWALVYTAILVLTFPVLLCFAAWVLRVSGAADTFTLAVAAGLVAAAVMLLTIQLPRQLCRPGGLGPAHFQWRDSALKAVRRHMLWLGVLTVPLYFVVGLLEHQPLESHSESLGRAAFIVAFAALTVFVARLFAPNGALVGPQLQRKPAGWLNQLRWAWYVLLVAIPAGVTVLAILGYYYTGLYVGRLLLYSIWVVATLLVVSAFVQRWLLLYMQRRAIREAEARRAEEERKRREAEDAGEPRATAEEGIVLHEEDLQVSAADISAQTTKFVRLAVLVVGAIGLWYIWAGAAPAVAPIWEAKLAGSALTIGNVLSAIIVFVITVIATRNLPGLLQVTILERLPLEASGKYAINRICTYLIAVVGVVLAFQAINVGWGQVQWLVAAMTVGLGFGLQEIFANFVSGLIILFERPIRVGDIVTVSGTSGVVSRIRIRATTITDWDRKEFIVPNKRFITGEVLNWTLSDSILRVCFPVRLVLGSDVAKAREMLLRLANDHEKVLDDPAPFAIFLGMGESFLNVELRVYVKREDFGAVLDELNTRIQSGLREAGLEIAVPRQEMIVQSVDGRMSARFNASSETSSPVDRSQA